MKNLMMILLALTSFSAMATLRPLTKEHKAIEARVTATEAVDAASEIRVAALEAGNSLVKSGVFTVSTTKAAASTFALTGAIIPAGSIILSLTARVKTLIVAANSNTIALGCTSGAGLLAATDYSAQAANYILAATSTMPYYAATACTVTGTVGAGASGITAGAMEVYVQYLDLL